ncbi:unnamed protein product [Penicillium palitans]
MDLLEAVKSGREDTVKLLPDNGANPNADVDGFGTILHAAAFAGDITIVQLLLERGANSNAQGGEYGTTLQAAAFGGDLPTVQLLLEKGAEINAQGGEYGNALQAAAASANTWLVRLLLERGADVNAQGGKFGTALQSCLQHEKVCYFSKQDTMFWVKVLKKHADQPASLVDLMHLTERRKQRSRLRECATIWTRGEVVSVSSARRLSP